MTSQTLRNLADARSFAIGTCVDMAVLESDTKYRETLAREFNTCVAENVFKPHQIWVGPCDYDFGQPDIFAEFVKEQGLMLRGHTLVWHQSTPMWLREGKFSPGDVKDLLRNYISAVVGRYKGLIPVWDVVNEAISDSDDSHFRQDSFWLQVLGPEFINQAFEWAHQADPACKLYYNDYEAESLNEKSGRVYELVTDLKSAGAPIHGVGLQGHLINGWRVNDDYRANVHRLSSLGLEWQYTEVDIRMVLDGKMPTDRQLIEQADGYRDLMELCLKEPGCTGFLTWGFTDQYSWIPGFRKGQGAALLFDDQYRPKPAYFAIADALRARS